MYNTTADPTTGAWQIQLEPFVPVGDIDTNSFTLALTGSNGGEPIVSKNVAYGDVILCSGTEGLFYICVSADQHVFATLTKCLMLSCRAV
jgi:hypothetical protein